LVLTIIYFHSGTTIGRELKKKKEKNNSHMPQNNVKVLMILKWKLWRSH
jgi:hypothetical protein